MKILIALIVLASRVQAQYGLQSTSDGFARARIDSLINGTALPGGAAPKASPVFTGSGWIDGRFGIGTSPSTSKLTIRDSTGGNSLLSFSSANYTPGWYFSMGNIGLRISSEDGGDILGLAGAYPNFLIRLASDGGRVLVNGATDVAKATLNVSGQIKTTMLSAALTDGTPTATEINTATGSTPAAVTAGWEVWIKDTDGTSLMYRVVSDGTSWWTDPMTVAP